MPPRLSAAEKGKGRAKRGGGGGGDDEVPLASLVARLTRADLEALLLSHEEERPELREEVNAKLQPAQVRHERAQRQPQRRVRALPCRCGDVRKAARFGAHGGVARARWVCACVAAASWRRGTLLACTQQSLGHDERTAR
jgi:hypothetical protein